MALTGSVIVPIEVRDLTQKGLRSAETGLTRFGQVSDRAFGLASKGALALGGAVTGLGVGLAALTKRTADFVGEMEDIADTTGVSVRQISSLTEEFKRFGQTGQDVNDVLNEINISITDAQIGTESVIDAFATFGISLEDINNNSTYEILLQLADGFSTIENEALRAHAARQIFGEGVAQDTVPILLQGSEVLLQNAEAYATLGLVIDDVAVNASARFDLAQQNLRGSLEGLGNTISLAVMPHLTNLINSFNALIALGRGFANLLPQLQTGTVSFGQAFSAVWASLPPEIQNTLTLLGLNFGAALNNMLQSLWSFGFGVEQGFADIVNDMLDQVDPLSVLPRATPGTRFSGDAPQVTIPKEIVDAGRREQLRTQITRSRYIPGADASPAHTVVAGDTLWDLQRRGIDTSAFTGDPRELPIGFQFPGSTGTQGRFVREPLQANQGIVDAYGAYLQSLVQPARSTPEAQAAAATEARATLGDAVESIVQNPLPALIGATAITGGLRAGWSGLNWATLGVPRATARAIPSLVRRGGNIATGFYNNRVTQRIAQRVATGVGDVSAFGRPSGRTFGATGVGDVSGFRRPSGRTWGAWGVGDVSAFGRPSGRTFGATGTSAARGSRTLLQSQIDEALRVGAIRRSGTGLVNLNGRPVLNAGDVDEALRIYRSQNRGQARIPFAGGPALQRGGRFLAPGVDEIYRSLIFEAGISPAQARSVLVADEILSQMSVFGQDDLLTADYILQEEFQRAGQVGRVQNAIQYADELLRPGAPRGGTFLQRFAQELAPGLRFVGRVGGLFGRRVLPVIDLLEAGGSQPSEGRGGNYRRGSGPRSNLPYFDLRRFMQDRAQLLPQGAIGRSIQPLTAFRAPGADFNPAINQLLNPNPAWQFQGDPYSFAGRYPRPYTVWDQAYNPPPPQINIINIEVNDQQTFAEQLADALESGDVPVTMIEAYDQERRGGE